MTSTKSLPEPGMEFLFSLLANQATAYMGLVPEENGKPEVRLDLAKVFVDTLAILEEKTKGNLTDSEGQFLQAVIHQLRLVYVGLSNSN